MVAQLTVLASGSSGNASLFEVDGVGILIDCGLPPKILGERLTCVGKTWASIQMVLLTHTHSDHWNRHMLAQLRQLNIPIMAHPQHHAVLACRPEYLPLHRAKLTRDYTTDRDFPLTSSVSCRAITVPHDAEPTFAFRFESRPRGTATVWSLGFASDVGHVTEALLEGFSGVDVLALEFNHDVALQQSSPRPQFLIDRVLGNYGHLSNVQAAEATAKIAASSGTDRFSCLIQLHLSRQCNAPELAIAAGKQALRKVAPQAAIVTASQHEPTPTIVLGCGKVPVLRRPRRQSIQPRLPLKD